MAETSNITR